MQINLTITVKKVEAKDFAEAKELVLQKLISTMQMKRNLWAVGVMDRDDFMHKAHAAREVDGTYTVTIP